MEGYIVVIGIGSLVFSVAALVAILIFLIRLPRDYFAGPEPSELPLKARHPWLNFAIRAAKNVLGVFLILVGSLLLALPGQGILTILVGLILLDFPGKRELELRLVKRPKVLSALNWIRRKLGEEPFEV